MKGEEVGTSAGVPVREASSKSVCSLIGVDAEAKRAINKKPFNTSGARRPMRNHCNHSHNEHRSTEILKDQLNDKSQ